MTTADSTVLRIQVTTPTESERYTPASADLPRVYDWVESPCPFLPQPEPEPTSYDWTKFIHPNGTPYWYNSERSTILANHAYDLTNEDQSLRLVKAIDVLWTVVREHTNPPVSSATATTSGDQHVMADYELFIDIDHESPNSTVRYYFVDWGGRTVFWRKSQKMFQAASKEHLVAQLHAQFWTHVAAYPMHHPLPPGSSEELCSIMGYHILESIQSWPGQDMQFILFSLTQGSRYSMDSKPQLPAEETRISNATIARLWCDICQTRASNFYGDPRANKSRMGRRLYSTQGQHPIARTVLSIIFFNRPSNFEPVLEKIFAGNMLNRGQWREYVEKEIEPEWQGTQAAIMLAANMAFLALNSVQQANDGPFLACKTLSLSSTTFSVAALFATLKLARIHQRWRSATAEEASEHMSYCSQRIMGLFGLAMIYSIPFAMFMWSLFTFVAAVLLYAFQHWTRDAGLPLITATVVPIVALLVWEWWFFEARAWKTAPAASDTDRSDLSTTITESATPERPHRSGSSRYWDGFRLQAMSIVRAGRRRKSRDAERGGMELVTGVTGQ